MPVHRKRILTKSLKSVISPPLCLRAMYLHGRRRQINHPIQLPKSVLLRRIILMPECISQQVVMQRVRIHMEQRILLRIVLIALLPIQKKRPGTVRLRETIIMILRINQKGIMQLYHISIRHLTSRMILHIDLSQIRKKMLGIVKRQEITTTIQYTNPRGIMLQVLINIQRRTLKKIRLIVL